MVLKSSKKNRLIPSLSHQHVHVWVIDLSSNLLSDEVSLLSDDEKLKVSRLQSDQHKVWSTVAHVRLRQLLAQYLECDPQSIEFDKGIYGKPTIKGVPVFFNLSHSNNMALVAISLTSDIGVDIEEWRLLDNLEGMVVRNFSESEKKEWSSLDNAKKQAIFFNLWACKESFIKATGRGLGLGVSKCSFSFKWPHSLLVCPQEYGDASEWTCTSLNIANRVSAAVSIKQPSCEISVYSFDKQILPTFL